MDSEKIMNLFDTCWFEMEILKNQSRSSTCSIIEATTRDHQNEEKPLKAGFLRIPPPSTFELVLNCNHADMQISFQSRDQGDGYPFDGQGNIMAHSFRLTNGSFHFDADEKWVVGAVPGSYDMQTAALHELGREFL